MATIIHNLQQENIEGQLSLDDMIDSRKMLNINNWGKKSHHQNKTQRQTSIQNVNSIAFERHNKTFSYVKMYNNIY